MQVAPQNPSTATPTTMIELFSRFLSRLLEKEEKYPIFLKEWESFKSLLTKTELDLDAAFIHIASIQINIQKAINSLSFTNLKTEKFSTPQKAKNEEKSNTSLGHGMHHHRSASASFAKLAEEYSRISATINCNTSISTAHSTLDDIILTRTVNTTVNTPIHENYGFIKFPDILDTAKKPYPLSFLAQKAKELKEHCNKNSNGLLEGFERKTQKDYSEAMAERTPLRRLVVYSRQSAEATQPDQHNALYTPLQNLTSQLEINNTSYPYNNAFISFNY